MTPRVAPSAVPSLDSKEPLSTSSCLLTLTRIWQTAPDISDNNNCLFIHDCHKFPHGVSQRGIRDPISIIFYIGFITIRVPEKNFCRSQWPRGLRCVSAAACVLELRFRIPPGGMDVCLVCVVRQRSQRRADHSSREALPNVVRRRVRPRNLKNKEAKVRFSSSGTGTRRSVKNYDMFPSNYTKKFGKKLSCLRGPGSSVGIATCYGLDGP